MSNKREPGYYWVRIDEWYGIAEYGNSDVDIWLLTGTENNYPTCTFDKIGSRITPEMRYTEEDMVAFGVRAIMSEYVSSVRPFTMDDFRKRSKQYFNDWLELKQTQRKEEE